MPGSNETSSVECRFLHESHFSELYEVFITAFSDYDLPFNLTEQQFKNHIQLNAVDLRRSVGAFDSAAKLVGFTLNGFGDWKGRRTVYDAGSGVLPGHRRKGIARAMFDFLIPRFSEDYEQILLEVITTNERAIKLYDQLGFKVQRELSFLEAEGEVDVSRASEAVEIEEIDKPDWTEITSFRDFDPSWQNSNDAMDRSRGNKVALAAILDGSPAGYILFSKGVGRIAQLAVQPAVRCTGVGTRLVAEMIARTDPENRPRAINVDTTTGSKMAFLQNRGFTEKLRQYEMLLEL